MPHRRRPLELVLGEYAHALSLTGLRRDQLFTRALYVASLLVLIAIGIHLNRGAPVAPGDTAASPARLDDDCFHLSQERRPRSGGHHAAGSALPSGGRLTSDSPTDQTEQ